MELARYDALIGAIYDAAFSPQRWPEVVASVCDNLRGSAGLLFTPRHPVGNAAFAVPVNIPPWVMQSYAERYHYMDLWTQAGVAKGMFKTGAVVRDDELVPRNELLTSVYFREFLQPAGISRLCVTVVFGDEESTLPPTVLSIYRGLDATAFGSEECGLLRLLVPHISRSLGVMFRLESAEAKLAASLAALDSLDHGVVLLGESGRFLHANRPAHELLDGSNGLTIVTDAVGRRALVAVDKHRNRRLQALITSALPEAGLNVSHFSQGLLIPGRLGNLPIYVSVSRLAKENPYGMRAESPVAICFLIRRKHDALLKFEQLAFAKLFSLTPAEQRLIEGLVAGNTLAAIAGEQGLSLHTVRDRLKKIFVKTNTHRQTDLVRLVMSCGQ